MRTLLVQAESPPTYWGYQYALKLARKSAALPPLGLATVAALLPRSLELRLHDMHLGPLPDEAIRWADAVLVGGMLVQARSMIGEVVSRARIRGRHTVVGGPAPSTSPESFSEADHLFQGEVERRLDLLVRVLESRSQIGPRMLSPQDGARPDVRLSPVPRFDLVDLRRYTSPALQISRGCPFNCEFCDIIEIFGRTPRVKTAEQVIAEQVIAELEALRRQGARGSLFFLDDNFIGNRRAVARMLPRIAEWQRQNGRPFDFYMEASVDLATEPALVQAWWTPGSPLSSWESRRLPPSRSPARTSSRTCGWTRPRRWRP